MSSVGRADAGSRERGIIVPDRPSRTPYPGVRGLLLCVLTAVLIAAGAVPAYAATDTEPPSAPGPITVAEITTTSVLLTWTPATDNVGVDRYEVSQFFTDVVVLHRTTATGLRLTGLRPSRAYAFGVRAVDAAGNSSPSSRTLRLIMPPGDDVPPSVPGGLRVTGVAETAVDLAWDASTDNVQLAGYEVLSISPSGTTVVATVWLVPPANPSTAVRVTRLTAGTTYTFAVRARDEAGNYSALSAPVTVTTPSASICSVGYRVAAEWTTGLLAQLTIRAIGSVAIDGWTLTWAFPDSQPLLALWGAELVRRGGGTLTVRHPADDRVILPGETHFINYVTTAPAPTPTRFVLNDSPCVTGG